MMHFVLKPHSSLSIHNCRTVTKYIGSLYVNYALRGRLIHTHTHARARTHMHTHPCMHARTHKQTDRQTDTHTHTHTHTHTLDRQKQFQADSHMPAKSLEATGLQT